MKTPQPKTPLEWAHKLHSPYDYHDAPSLDEYERVISEAMSAAREEGRRDGIEAAAKCVEGLPAAHIHYQWIARDIRALADTDDEHASSMSTSKLKGSAP